MGVFPGTRITKQTPITTGIHVYVCMYVCMYVCVRLYICCNETHCTLIVSSAQVGMGMHEPALWEKPDGW